MTTTAMTLGLAAAGVTTAALAVGAWQYAANWPTSQLFGRTFIDAPEKSPAHPTVHLTFDDGPSTRNTPALLDALASAGAVATFFLVGNHVRRHPQLARRIAEAGHVLGNHTDMHPNLSRKPATRIRAELQTCQNTIADTTGITPTLFRPPYGARRPLVLGIARELGLTTVLWNIAAADWSEPSVPWMLERIDSGMERNLRRGRTSNILLHDASQLDGNDPQNRASTVAVVEALLRRPALRFTGVATT